MTIFGGLSHPTSRLLVGHNTVDVWLTGADIRVNLQNSISIDQVIARHAGAHTRIPSLVLSSHGGVGTKSRSTTISFDAQGRAIPAESAPRRIFERLFEPPANGDRAARERALASGRRRVDFLLEDSRSLRNNLGRPDQQRLDEFLQSLSEVETRLARAQDWLGKALPQVDREAINLDVSPSGPTDYIRTMLNLIVLAFETDTTRVAAYQICAEDGVGICDRFPSILGIGRRRTSRPQPRQTTRATGPSTTAISPNSSPISWTGSPRSAKGTSRLLDNTMALYGSGTSTTHNARNYPTILAGGRNLGLRHGRFIKHETERPLGDLYVTMLQRYDIPVRLVRRQRGRVFRNPRESLGRGDNIRAARHPSAHRRPADDRAQTRSCSVISSSEMVSSPIAAGGCGARRSSVGRPAQYIAASDDSLRSAMPCLRATRPSRNSRQARLPSWRFSRTSRTSLPDS